MLYTVAAIDKPGNEVYHALVLELVNTQRKARALQHQDLLIVVAWGPLTLSDENTSSAALCG